ncbi:MAG: hypothetical protein KatS3mg131_3785 [Candidatus Tectimicrobiota bacterium]|nr:MAG: hypothetical protein KatS3mg131_3785 [Candidatus Tectomicrobia bacterium]
MSLPTPEQVSIVIAAYNAEATLERCLRSLLALAHPAREILVVDNNSRDATAAIVRRYEGVGGIRYLYEPQRGWPAARNAGIAAARCPYVANIDADCAADPQWLDTLLRAFTGERVGCVVGRTLVEPGTTWAQRFYARSDPFCIEGKIGTTPFVPWGGGNNVMRRDVFLRAGGYDAARFTSGADAEFHYRLEKQFGYCTKYEPRAIIYHRARGSLRELFAVSAKYAHDGFLRACEPEMQETRQHYRYFLLRKLFDIGKHLAGMGVRSGRAALGRGTWFDVACNGFTVVCLCGTLAGYCRARARHLWRQWSGAGRPRRAQWSRSAW